MKEVEYIVGIYNNFNPIPEDPTYAGYYFMYLLDQKGLLDFEDAQKIFLEKNSIIENSEVANLGYIGPFESVEGLNQYAFLLCEQLNAEKVSLLSVLEYNSLLEGATNAADFHNDLLEKGNVLKNIERKKKGLISRFFK